MTDPNGHTRWQRIEELFFEASLLSSADRGAFLSVSCAGDVELCNEVASLLTSADLPLEPLLQPVFDAVDTLPNVSEEFTHDSYIGPYKIERLLGQGGMGRVYLAARNDLQYRQKVAIKTMQAGEFASSHLLARFRAERQILADLNHPNIARLLDGGITGAGTPYLVMEYVEGVPIDQHCRENNLPVADRLSIFGEVCAAVDYAHRHLVVHRDLKPANILVTTEGVPKLLDFGIAKLLALEPGTAAGAATGSFERMLTPDYASPEQLLGHPVSTATDVYGLGALLYELLSGVPPFTFDSQNPMASVRLIVEVTPEAPSSVAPLDGGAAPPDAGLVKGDLDRIVLMALRKEPSRRYASAMRLAEDIEAWLKGFPIQARTATWTYIAQRFTWRHRWAVAAAASFLVVLLGFSIAMAYLNRESHRQETIARQQAEFLASLFQASTPDSAKGRTVTAREVLDAGEKRIRQRNDMDPEVRAALLYDIAQSYRALGLYDNALRLAQQAFDIQSRLHGRNSGRVAPSLSLLASSYRDLGDYQQAEPLFRHALQIIQASEAANSVALESAQARLGECLYLLEKDAEAESILRQALAIDRLNPSAAGSETRNYLALLLERRAAFPEAATLLGEAVLIDRTFAGADSSSYADSVHNLAGAQIDAGDLVEAEATMREGLALRRKLLGNEHPDLAFSLNNLAYLLLERGDWKSAMPLAHEASELCLRRLGDRQLITATATGNLGRAYEAKGDYVAADDYYKRAIAMFRLSGAPEGLAVSQMLHYRAQLQFDQGHYAVAEALERHVLDMRRSKDPNSVYSASSLIDVAEARVFEHDATGAVPLLREALALRRGHYPATHPLVIAVEVRLGEALWRSGSPDAGAVLADALHLARTAPYPLFFWQVAEAESALGASLKSSGQNADGAKLLAESRAALASHPRPVFRLPADLRYR